ncbi:MAG: hypothetical protein BWY89_01799 [Bacteroidetes bacterium ADurb.BinA012]|nr:MAG: hypothetical protein BWY89_01799 [Bacteroidetes bacterium ADurb.BinA012]
MVSNGVSPHVQPVPEGGVFIVAPLKLGYVYGITPEFNIIKRGNLKPVLPPEAITAMFASAYKRPGIIAHIIHHKAINRYIFYESPEIFPVHVKEVGIIVAESFKLILFGISPASVTQVYLADIIEIMTFILSMFGGNRVTEQQNVMPLGSVQFSELLFSPGPFNMVT